MINFFWGCQQAMVHYVQTNSYAPRIFTYIQVLGGVLVNVIHHWFNPTCMCERSWQVDASSWLGARRRPRHETVFLLVHCTGATARAHFFLLFFFPPQWNLFFCLFLLFFWRGVGWGRGGRGGWGGVITFFGLEHIWDGTSWDLFLEFNTSGMVRHEIFSWN